MRKHDFLGIDISNARKPGNVSIARSVVDTIERLPDLPKKWMFQGFEYEVFDSLLPDKHQHMLIDIDHRYEYPIQSLHDKQMKREDPRVLFRNAVRQALRDGIGTETIEEILKVEMVDVVMTT